MTSRLTRDIARTSKGETLLRWSNTSLSCDSRANEQNAIHGHTQYLRVLDQLRCLAICESLPADRVAIVDSLDGSTSLACPENSLTMSIYGGPHRASGNGEHSSSLDNFNSEVQDNLSAETVRYHGVADSSPRLVSCIN